MSSFLPIRSQNDSRKSTAMFCNSGYEIIKITFKPYFICANCVQALHQYSCTMWYWFHEFSNRERSHANNRCFVTTYQKEKGERVILSLSHDFNVRKPNFDSVTTVVCSLRVCIQSELSGSCTHTSDSVFVTKVNGKRIDLGVKRNFYWAKKKIHRLAKSNGKWI